jgi:hypothetical protein
MPWRDAIAVCDRREELNAWNYEAVAKSYACYGRNFTSRRADNYEDVFKFLRVDTPAKIFYAGEQRKHRREILRLRLAPSLREGKRKRETPLRMTGFGMGMRYRPSTNTTSECVKTSGLSATIAISSQSPNPFGCSAKFGDVARRFGWPGLQNQRAIRNGNEKFLPGVDA